MSKYKYQKNKVETVEVKVPSGNIFLMEKPSKYSVLFNIGSLPQSLTEKAVDSWKEQGIGNEALTDVVEQTSSEDKLKLVKMSLKIRDAVYRLSVEPKIVGPGEAASDNELSVDEISDEDLDFLFKWAASGGTAAPGVADFRSRPEQDALASASRKTKREKAVATGGAA